MVLRNSCERNAGWINTPAEITHATARNMLLGISVSPCNKLLVNYVTKAILTSTLNFCPL